jgi:hypothetical protein
MNRSLATMEASGSTRFPTAALAFLLLLVVLCSLLQSPAALAGPVKPSYIVYLGGHPVSPAEASLSAAESHYDLLGAVLGE